MKKYNLKMKIILAIIILLITIIILLFIKGILVKDMGYIYIAPSSTDVMYGDNTAYLIGFDSNGDTKSYNIDAYPFSGLVNFKDELIFQNKKGTQRLEGGIKNQTESLSGDTVGYNMSEVLGEKYYYFLSNESFKGNYYSSKLIIGDKSNEYTHEVQGFINSYGNDEDDIYLLTDDMINRNNKQIQKISVNEVNKMNSEYKNISLNNNIDSNFKMIVLDEFIYAFVIKDSCNISILKIEKSTLEVDDMIDVIKFDPNVDGDSYYPISTNAIFKKDKKIYYAAVNGIVYSYDISNKEFKEEFSLEDYSIESCSNPLLYFYKEKNQINILFFNEKDKNYYVNCYDINGKILDKIKLKSLKINNGCYPHNFIRVE